MIELAPLAKFIKVSPEDLTGAMNASETTLRTKNGKQYRATTTEWGDNFELILAPQDSSALKFRVSFEVGFDGKRTFRQADVWRPDGVIETLDEDGNISAAHELHSREKPKVKHRRLLNQVDKARKEASVIPELPHLDTYAAVCGLHLEMMLENELNNPYESIEATLAAHDNFRRVYTAIRTGTYFTLNKDEISQALDHANLLSDVAINTLFIIHNGESNARVGYDNSQRALQDDRRIRSRAIGIPLEKIVALEEAHATRMKEKPDKLTDNLRELVFSYTDEYLELNNNKRPQVKDANLFEPQGMMFRIKTRQKGAKQLFTGNQLDISQDLLLAIISTL